jgi:hypothetical protein
MENACMVIKQDKKKEKERKENAYHTKTTNLKIEVLMTVTPCSLVDY